MGVSCSRRRQRVVALQFRNFPLYGTISPQLANLSFLSVLLLSNNSLVGPIPDSLSQLPRLKELVLQLNQLSGSIPPAIFNMSLLAVLSLHVNNLSGTLPSNRSFFHSMLPRIQFLSLSENQLSGNIPTGLCHCHDLRILSLSFNQFSGNIPIGLGNLKQLRQLILGINNLTGTIPLSLSNLTSLLGLHLSDNSFQGSIPKELGSLSHLQHMDISSNHTITDPIPISLSNLSSLFVLDLVNCTLSGPIRVNFRNMPHLKSLLLGGNMLTGGLDFLGSLSNNNVLGIIALEGNELDGLLPNTIGNLSRNLYVFSASDNHISASDNHLQSEINLLGRGRFGSVYKGCLDDGLLTAVKVMNLEVDGASRSFDVECNALRMVRHRNLVRIITTCSNLDRRALVLQFMPNGSLEMWLYSRNSCLSLLQRINIAFDVASALEHFHHNHSHVVLHCDLKPSNVLLDEEMTAHLSDFGIAKLLGSDGRSTISTNTPGTIGYISPEYASTGRVSRKGDVYSFGILLLEMLTRKKPTDPMFVGESSLRRWICDAHPDTLLEIVDSNLLKDGSGNEMASKDQISMHECLSSILELGIICSRDAPKERPAMKEVVPKLQKIKTYHLSLFPVV